MCAFRSGCIYVSGETRLRVLTKDIGGVLGMFRKASFNILRLHLYGFHHHDEQASKIITIMNSEPSHLVEFRDGLPDPAVVEATAKMELAMRNFDNAAKKDKKGKKDKTANSTWHYVWRNSILTLIRRFRCNSSERQEAQGFADCW